MHTFMNFYICSVDWHIFKIYWKFSWFNEFLGKWWINCCILKKGNEIIIGSERDVLKKAMSIAMIANDFMLIEFLS